MQKKLNNIHNNKEETVVGLYVRVSTQEQARDGYSIQEQTERLTKYAEAHDWIVKEVYSDAGYSGAKLDRPAMQKLIEDVEQHQIEKIIVYKLDRLSRSQKDTLYLIEDVFLAHNVDFVSMTENFDTSTPFGKAMIGILSVFAQLEREQIKERMEIGVEGRAKAGLWTGGGIPPTGYTYKNGQLHIDPYEAEIVRRIYREFLNGKSIARIDEELRKDGLKGSCGPLNRSTIRNILSNSIYAGYIHFRGQMYQGQHEAIVSKEDWEKTSEMIKEQAQTDVHHLNYDKRAGLVTSLCYCGECGQKMISRYWKRKDGSYNKNIVCPHKGLTGCKSGCYNCEAVEQAVISQLVQLQLDPDCIADIRTEKKENKETGKTIEAYEKKIEENGHKISKLMDLYTIDGIDMTELSGRISSLIENNQKLTDQIRQLKKDMETDISDDEVVDRVARLGEYLELDDHSQARKIIASLIDRIVLSEGNHVTIYWKF